jgi:hypothetical protein
MFSASTLLWSFSRLVPAVLCHRLRDFGHAAGGARWELARFPEPDAFLAPFREGAHVAEGEQHGFLHHGFGLQARPLGGFPRELGQPGANGHL